MTRDRSDDDNESVENTGVSDDDESVETQEWRPSTTTITNPSKTLECAELRNTNGLHKQKRLAELQHSTTTTNPEPGPLQHRNSSIICLQIWIQK
jgi:hypothetical protein